MLTSATTVRDEWESKKADFEKELSDLLGVEWTTDINPNALYPYTSEGYSRDSMGSCIASYGYQTVSSMPR